MAGFDATRAPRGDGPVGRYGHRHRHFARRRQLRASPAPHRQHQHNL